MHDVPVRSHHAVFCPGMPPARFEFLVGPVNQIVDLFRLEDRVDRLEKRPDVRVPVTQPYDFEIISVDVEYLNAVGPDATFSQRTQLATRPLEEFQCAPKLTGELKYGFGVRIAHQDCPRRALVSGLACPTH